MNENEPLFYLFDDDDIEPKPVTLAELAELPAGIWSVRRLPVLLLTDEEEQNDDAN